MADLVVVIPALNAEAGLRRLLKQVAGDPDHKAVRVVVADGGSEDGSLRVTVRAGAVIAAGSPGRGQQLRRGVDWALRGAGDGAWVLVLHADTVLPEGWAEMVWGHIAAQTAKGSRKAAHFGYAPQTGLTRRDALTLRGFVRLRELAWGLPYGDQGLLMSGALYRELGGYHAMALFEDVDMVTRIKRATGRLVRLPGCVETDASAYVRDGVWARGRRNLGLLRAYRSGVGVEELVRRYRGET